MVNDIKKILEIAIHAPSGENCQPWKFKIKDNQIYLFNIPERDQSPYNFGQRGAFVSHGALIENISIASLAVGLKAKISLFPERDDPNLVAIISFAKSMAREESLFPYILERTTNRRAYKKIPLTTEQRQAILNSANQISKGKILLTENKEDIKILSLVGAMNERLVLENEVLHHFLFSHINWTEKENQEKKIGFYIKTLELPPPAQLAFKIFSSWKVLKKLNKIGISKAIWKQNGRVYGSCSAIGIITTQGNNNEDFVNVGKVMQRMWLTATKLSLSLQPMTGILFFMQRIIAGRFEPFSSDQIKLIQESYENVRRIFKLRNETVPMMFRTGYSDPPTARALKLEPEIVFD